MRICIVTPDLIGPAQTGDIGTHSFYLTKFALSEGAAVTVLFTEPVHAETETRIRSELEDKLGAELITLAEIQENDLPRPGRLAPTSAITSLVVARWLAKEEARFDLVFFYDWKANGFHSSQIKRCGLAFRSLPFAIILHSPSEWRREGMQILPQNGLEGLILDFHERTAAEHCDFVIAPDPSMLEWARGHGWQLPEHCRVLPPLLTAFPEPSKASGFDGEDVIFFGRLEKRKGLELFIRSLQQIEEDLKATGQSVRIHFLGKSGTMGEIPAIEWLKEELSRSAGPWEIQIMDTLDHQSSIQYLREHKGALVVMPSLLESTPLNVIEAVTLGLNVLPTNVRGVAELFDSEARLPEPTIRGLTSHLRAALVQKRFVPLKMVYSPERTRHLWTRFLQGFPTTEQCGTGTPRHYTLYPGKPEGDPSKRFQFLEQRGPGKTRASRTDTPAITVCIPYFNAAAYLSDTLRSLDAQQFDSFEVVVVDDGSTEAQSVAFFDEMRTLYEPSGWRFFRKSNEGIGATRNFAAGRARGKYLVFMDADNIANPEMLLSMFQSIENARVDCMTCYCTAFRHGDLNRQTIYSYMPIGGDLAAGMLANVFGDANFIIRREVFEKMGGFGVDRRTSYEDYDFLFRLVEQGWSLAVIPQFLFFYRHLEQGFSKVTNGYANRLRAIGGALEKVPDWQRRFIMASLGVFEKSPQMHMEVAKKAQETGRHGLLERLRTTFGNRHKGINN